MEKISVGNLALINKKFLVFVHNRQLVPSLTEVPTDILTIEPFSIDRYGSKLIVFIISHQNVLNLLIFQEVINEGFFLIHPIYNLYYPQDILPYLSQFSIKEFHLLDVPDENLRDLSLQKLKKLNILFDSYSNRNVDVNFFENILEVKLSKDKIIPNIYSSSFPSTSGKASHSGSFSSFPSSYSNSATSYVPFPSSYSNSAAGSQASSLTSYVPFPINSQQGGSMKYVPTTAGSQAGSQASSLTSYTPFPSSQAGSQASSLTGYIPFPTNSQQGSLMKYVPITESSQQDYNTPIIDQTSSIESSRISPIISPDSSLSSSPTTPLIKSPVIKYQPSSPSAIKSPSVKSLDDIPQNIKHDKPIISVSTSTTNKVIPNMDVVAGKKKEILGTGTYGEVYQTTKGLAVKKFQHKNLHYSILNETSILIYLNHPNIISIINVQLYPIKISMEIANGNLSNYELNTKDERKWIFYQILRGLEYCHKMGIWHRDIKPDNILIFEQDMLVKIADFGISVIHPRNDLNYEVVTMFWRAPEILLAIPGYDETIDEWGVGVMLLDKITNQYNFPGNDNTSHILSIIRILGIPSYEQWKEGATEINSFLATVTKGDWLKDHPFLKNAVKNLQENNFKRTLEKLAIIDPDEFTVIYATINWPTARMKCSSLMKLPYFQNYEYTMNINFPANSENIDNSLDILIRDQRQIIRKDWFVQADITNRKKVLDWLYQVVNDFRFTSRTLFYTIVLFDIVCSSKEINISELQAVATICMKISAKLWEDGRVIEDSKYILILEGQVNEDNINIIENEILRIIDFRTVFTTVEDFVYYHTISLIDDVKYKKVMFYIFLLMLDYDYVCSYTSYQLARIGIRAALGKEFVFKHPQLSNMSNLFTDEIRNYLLTYQPTDEMRNFYNRFFN